MSSKENSFFFHIKELKLRLLISFGAFVILSTISYCFAKEIYSFLMRPLESVLGADTNKRFIYTNLTEVFFAYLKLSVFSGFILSFPIIMSQLYLFIAPGLYKNEKKCFIPFLVASPTLFLIGGAFVYFFVFPMAWKFFLSFEVPATDSVLPILLEAKVSEYLSLVIGLIVAFGLAFQIPVILLLLVKLNFIDANWLRKKRKIAILVIFILAAILTPPDVVSQIALAIPMLLLYELSILACKYVQSSKVE